MEKLFIPMLFIFFALLSCSKEDLKQQDKNGADNSVEISVIEQDKIIEDLAKMFAYSNNQTSFLNFINEELSNNDVVWYYEIINKKYEDNKVFADFLYEISIKLGMSYNKDFFTNYMPNNIPKLTISIYNPVDNIKTISKDEKLLVFPVTQKFIDDNIKQQIGYYPDLTKKSYSDIDEPSEKIIILQNNPDYLLLNDNNTGSVLSEYLDVQKNNVPIDLVENITKNSKTIIINNICYNLVSEKDVCYAINSIETQNGIDVINTKSTRNGTKREKVAKIQINNSVLSDFCPWYRSNCKIKVNTIFAVKSGDNAVLGSYPVKYIYEDRSDVKNNKICSIGNENGLTLFMWKYEDGDHGNPYALLFTGINQKTGSSTTYGFNLGYSVKFVDKNTGEETTYSLAGNFSHTVTVKDTDLGGDVIYYNDALNANYLQYSTGTNNFFNFSVTN